MANLQNTVTGLLFTFSAGLFVRIMYYKQQFGIFTVTFLLNQITTHKKASLKNIVTRLIIIFLCYSYSACHQNETLELLP